MKMIFLSLFFALAAIVAPAGLAQEKPAEEKKAAETRVQNLKPDPFDALRKADFKDTIVLDVRTKEENAKGRILGSILIDFTAGNFEKEVARLDKNKTYLVHCASGGRSARACKKMDQLGFKKLYNLEGGMVAWEKAGKPVEK